MNSNQWEDGARKPEHQRGVELENWLARLNDQLELMRQGRNRATTLHYAPFFIVGWARSGSTLLYQALAATGEFAYPTNIISRFHRDPYIGSLVHRVLFDMDRTGEIFQKTENPNTFRNKLGKTIGPDAPHEFNYLWRNYFTFGERQSQTLAKPEGARALELIGDLAAMEEIFGNPLLMKAMELNWQLPILHSVVPSAVFLFIRRDIFRNAWSLLKARKEFFGTEERWYSYKPEEYDRIKTLPPWEQVVAQVWFTERAVEQGFATIPADNRLDVCYEDFCKNPEEVFGRMRIKEPHIGPYRGPKEFAASTMAMPKELIERGARLLNDLQQW
jgi:hypothetical protein